VHRKALYLGKRLTITATLQQAVAPEPAVMRSRDIFAPFCREVVAHNLRHEKGQRTLCMMQHKATHVWCERRDRNTLCQSTRVVGRVHQTNIAQERTAEKQMYELELVTIEQAMLKLERERCRTAYA
jgi:hypothetical protein